MKNQVLKIEMEGEKEGKKDEVSEGKRGRDGATEGKRGREGRREGDSCFFTACTHMGLESPSRQLQISQTQDLGGPHGHVPPPACRRDL